MSGEGPQMKLAREQADKTATMVENVVFVDNNGIPMTRITCAAAELIPTRQYANVTIGPVQVQRYIFATTDEEIAEGIRNTQKLCEEAVAEDRQSVHALIQQSDGQRAQ